MPKGPKGQKRPADVIGNAVHVMRIATREITNNSSSAHEGKNEAAAALGSKGGKARAKKLGARRRKAIARTAAAARWGKK